MVFKIHYLLLLSFMKWRVFFFLTCILEFVAVELACHITPNRPSKGPELNCQYRTGYDDTFPEGYDQQGKVRNDPSRSPCEGHHYHYHHHHHHLANHRIPGAPTASTSISTSTYRQ